MLIFQSSEYSCCFKPCFYVYKVLCVQNALLHSPGKVKWDDFKEQKEAAETWSIPAVSINKDVTVITIPAPPGHSGRRTIPAITQPWGCSHSLWWAPRKLRMWKHRILPPDSWGTDQRNNFSEPGLLHFPIHRNTLNSVTWGIWFSLIYKNFWCSDYLSLVTKLLYNLAPLHPPTPPPRSSSIRVTWDTGSQA